MEEINRYNRIDKNYEMEAKNFINKRLCWFSYFDFTWVIFFDEFMFVLVVVEIEKIRDLVHA